MGQVFTWSAIRSGKIPRIESFHAVADLLRTQLALEPSIHSALLFGSVVRGDFNIRSDVDCVVLYETEQEARAMSVMQCLGQVAYQLHVPLEFTPCDTVLARTRLHHLGISFVTHLSASVAAGGMIKGSLAGVLAPTISPELEIESYIKMKMYKLQKSLAQDASFSEERLAAFLRKSLEAATHVARKMLIYEGRLRGDSKREVQNRYCETMPAEMAESLTRLLELDARYSSELQRQARVPDCVQYERVIARLRHDVKELLAFLRMNILRINEKTR